MSVSTMMTRLGRIAGTIEDLNGFRDSIATRHETMNGDFTDADRFRIAALNGNRARHLDALVPAITDLRAGGQLELVEEMHSLNELPAKNVEQALLELKAQLDGAAETVEEATVAVGTVTYDAANVGDFKVVTSLLNALGDTLHNVRAEDIVLECITDAQDGGITAGREKFRMRGEAALSVFDRSYPGGSGLKLDLLAVDSLQKQTKGKGANVANNSFDVFTVSNTPDDWELEVGAAGGTILETTSKLRGTNALEIKAHAAGELTQIWQAFGDSSESNKSTVRLKPRTAYAIGFWLKDGSTAPTAGVLRVAILDSGLSTVQHSSDKSVTLSTLTSSFTFHSVTFVTGENVGDDVRLVVELTTTMTAASSESFIIDGLVLTEMYRQTGKLGAPAVAAFSGATEAVIGDKATQPITRTGGVLQLYMDLMFGMHESGTQLPTANTAGATYKDALVV